MVGLMQHKEGKDGCLRQVRSNLKGYLTFKTCCNKEREGNGGKGKEKEGMVSLKQPRKGKEGCSSQVMSSLKDNKFFNPVWRKGMEWLTGEGGLIGLG